MKKSKMVATIISAIVVVVGVFAVVYNFVIVYNADLKYITYKNAEGTVTSVQSNSFEGNNSYRAVYTFGVNGANYAYYSPLTTDEEKYTVGMKGNIKYNSKNPSDCVLVDDSMNMNYLYLGISSIILIIGIKMFDKQLRVK